MANATLENVLKEVSGLTPDEQRQVRDVLNQILADQQEIEQQLQKALYQAGLLSEIKPSRAGKRSRRFQPIKVEGQPVSETIIEERR